MSPKVLLLKVTSIFNIGLRHSFYFFYSLFLVNICLLLFLLLYLNRSFPGVDIQVRTIMDFSLCRLLIIVSQPFLFCFAAGSSAMILVPYPEGLAGNYIFLLARRCDLYVPAPMFPARGAAIFQEPYCWEKASSRTSVYHNDRVVAMDGVYL